MILEDVNEEEKAASEHESSNKESSDDDYMELYVQKELKDKLEPLDEALT